MEEKTTDNRNTFAIKTFLKDYLDLRKDKDNELETVDSIRKGVEFKGEAGISMLKSRLSSINCSKVWQP